MIWKSHNLLLVKQLFHYILWMSPNKAMQCNYLFAEQKKVYWKRLFVDRKMSFVVFTYEWMGISWKGLAARNLDSEMM